ncbi:MAG: hypothetical protein RL291_286, partial [Pseudomonadota bacterium]
RPPVSGLFSLSAVPFARGTRQSRNGGSEMASSAGNIAKVLLLVGLGAGGAYAMQNRGAFDPATIFSKNDGPQSKSANAPPAPGTAPQARGPGGPGGPSAPPMVTTSKPVLKKVTEWDEYTGRFEAIENIELRARISGYLQEVHFKDGQQVKKGDLLYTIDPRPFQRALEQTQAELLQAKTRVENTTLDVDRGKPLVERKIMSEKVFDDRANALRDAQASVRVAEAKVKTAELDLFFTQITAPTDGRLSNSRVSAGSWISAGAAGNATLLTTIVTENPIHIYFDISENNWIKYKRIIDRGIKGAAAQLDSPISIGLPDETGFPHMGKIDFVDNRLDQATGTIRARAIVDNKSRLFSAGMFARVRVAGSPEGEAMLIPEEAIGTDQTNKFVLSVSEDGTVTRRNVQLGPVIEGLRIVRAGLTADEWIVTKGLARARPGSKVNARREPIGGPPSGPGGPATAKGPQAPAPKTQ